MFLLIDKPKGMTSHDVVDRVRGITGERRVGHAGTLDPNATGLLILGIGRDSTKQLGKITRKGRKTYRAEIFLGEERETDDSEGKVTSRVRGFLVPAEKEIKKIVDSFRGEIRQIPPAFSAIKLKGKKAYQLARKGKEVHLPSRKITIHSIKVLDYNYPILAIECWVSSGTYIRALARDIGRKIGCGAYLKELRRTKIDGYWLTKAVKLDVLNKANWKDFAIDYLR